MAQEARDTIAEEPVEASSLTQSKNGRREPLRRRLLVLNVGAVVILAIVIGGGLALKFVVADRLLASVQSEEQRADSDLASAQAEENAAAVAVESAVTDLRSTASSVFPSSVDEIDALREQVDFAKEVYRDAKSHKDEMASWAGSVENDLTSAHAFSDRTTTILYLGPIVLAALVLLYLLVRRHVIADDARKAAVEASLQGLERDDETWKSSKFEDLWTSNKQQLRHYHRLVLSYADASRRLTRLALGGGAIVLLAVGIFALLADTLFSAISASVVAAAGAVTTGYVARAVLRNSETSSRELGAFFAHPLEVERALAAERLIETMPNEERSKAKLIVIGFLARDRTAGSDATSLPQVGLESHDPAAAD